MIKLLSVSLPIFLFACNTFPLSKKQVSSTVKKDSIIVVVNRTNNKNYQFLYIGYFGNSERPAFPGNDTLKVKVFEPIVAYTASKPDFSDLTYFTIAPGDTITIDAKGYPTSQNAFLNEKLTLMKGLQFNAGSVNYSIKMDYNNAAKAVADNYLHKKIIVDNYADKVKSAAIKQARLLINFDYLTSQLALQTQFNKPDERIFDVLKAADSTSWSYLPFRDMLFRYKAYVGKFHQISQADQYVRYVQKNLPVAISDYAIFSLLKDYQPDSKSKLDTLNNLTNEFIKKTKYNILANYLGVNLTKYQQSLNAKNINDVALISQQTGHTTSLSALLRAHKNKIVYIDFWASWCAPCLAEMPSSHTLWNKLTKESPDIVFLYLSKDEDMAAWENKVSAIQLQPASSFLVLKNNALVDFSNKYSITTIPHYLIIGRDGKVINQDAPRPDDPKLESLFLKLTR